jgi:hypothetical protein
MASWKTWSNWFALTLWAFNSPTHPRFAQVSTIEFSLVEVSVLHGLKQGNAVLKEIHKELNVESVEKLLEETAEAREYQRVSSCPSSGYAHLNVFVFVSGNRQHAYEQPILG